MRVIAIGLATGALLLTGAVAAYADNGDGLEDCHNYEICFGRGDGYRFQRHFYGSDGDHSNNYFWDRKLNARSNYRLEDNAYKVRNRDSSCYVQVTDWNGAFPSVHDTIPNNDQWTRLNDAVRDQNNEHLRCPNS